jgi:peptidoglycan hydrolase CwlO-like protein
MSTEINLEYGDVLKAYQTKTNDLLTQLVTAEAKLNAFSGLINKLNAKIEELQQENIRLQKLSTKGKKPLINTSDTSDTSDTIVDYN